MYIISKNKDYYDGVAGTMGVDKTIVFERTIDITEENSELPKPFQCNERWLYQTKNIFRKLGYFDLIEGTKYSDFNVIVVGFCGKLHICWVFKHQWQNNISFGTHYNYEYIYDPEIAKKYLSVRHTLNIDDVINDVVNYDPIDIFREIKSPIFAFKVIGWSRHVQFIKNPILKELDFFKIYDSFTAFQEIQMFISGVLGVGNMDGVEISNDDKIKKHGFDKWSFRKESTKKRRKSK